MLLELQTNVIYGPIQSRRLGRSLGVNILPPRMKVCSFNCLYCQYGWTGIHRMDGGSDIPFPSVSEILKSLEETLASLSPPPAYITFSGNGEPTLHPDFGKIVDGVIEVRDRLLSSSKTAILSNSTRVSDSAVRKALSKLDARIMKFECGAEESFCKYNQPCQGVRLDGVIAGLTQLGDVTIQALFTKGSAGNFDDKNLRLWLAKVRQIGPVLVQLYTLDRGTPSRKIYPLHREELNGIKTQLEAENIRAEFY